MLKKLEETLDKAKKNLGGHFTKLKIYWETNDKSEEILEIFDDKAEEL
jgi:hypothetical protein